MSAVLTLAADVLVAASRRRTLWYYLLASTALVGALVLGADLSIVVRRVEAAGPLPRTITLGRALVPGSVEVEAGDQVARGHVALEDDGAGRLVEAGHTAARGSVDYATGVVTIAPPGVAAVDSLVVTSAVTLVGLGSAERERLYDEGTATHLTFFGQHVDHRELDARPSSQPRHAVPYLLTFYLFWLALIFVFSTFFGTLLGLLATADAVTGALEPGAAELLLSRPLSRVEVIAGRFTGALAFGLVQVGWLLGLSVLLVGLKLGLWLPATLLAIPAVLLKFAVLLAIASCAAVLTRTTVLGLAAAAVTWLVSFGLRWAPTEGPTADAGVWAQRLTPQVAQLDAVAAFSAQVPGIDLDLRGALVIVGLALAWVLGPLGLTAWVVSRRDY